MSYEIAGVLGAFEKRDFVSTKIWKSLHIPNGWAEKFVFRDRHKRFHGRARGVPAFFEVVCQLHHAKHPLALSLESACHAQRLSNGQEKLIEQLRLFHPSIVKRPAHVSPVVVQVDNNVAATRDFARVSASSGRPSGGPGTYVVSREIVAALTL